MAAHPLPTAQIGDANLSGPGELPPSALRRVCDSATLAFKTTNELPRLQNVIGQPRAFRALELGSAVTGPGFNIFALGLPDSGRTNLSRSYLERKAASEPVPDDWCYVNDFENPRQPKALRLPAGRAREFRADMQALLGQCEREIPSVFESDEYTQERDRLLNDLKKNQEAEFGRMAELAAKYNFALGRGPFGFVLMPSVAGKPLRPEEVEQLSPEQISKLTELEAILQDKITHGLERLREMERTTHQSLQELNTRMALFTVEHLIDSMKRKYAEMGQVAAYLESVKADMVTNADQFRARKASQGEEPGPDAARTNWLRRYDVNVVVDNTGCQGAPVVVESQPTYHNLLGRIEQEFVMGASSTDFTLIRPGALHRANGGYLILPARDVLLNPYAWDGLKRALRDGAIRILEPGTQLSLISTPTLEPEPIPLSTKVILIGTPLLYYLLNAHDEDFAKLFKVKAEFASVMDRTADTEHEYALFVKSVQDENHLLPFAHNAVARIIEHGSRLAGDQGKLSTRFGKIADLIREAAYWACKEGQPVVTAADVDRTLTEAIYRNNLLEERFQEMISQGTLAVDVSGAAVGQVNALSVVELGDYAFGHPTRVTASARPGQSGIIDIERKAELGGPIHTKGVLILNGCLGERYGWKRPLNLSASLAFEQSYEGVEGDSASAAELFALLSAIARIPLRQDIAMTGSINQHGQIQAIGGVNEKIEGFFAICRLRGLTGSQGVIIPASNVRNLNLRADVVDAVAAGEFHIWPITTADQGLALLSGCEPGILQADGSYPDGTFNGAVMARLNEFADVVEVTLKMLSGAIDHSSPGNGPG
jgi:lon-related putative ATP-dependent protease